MSIVEIKILEETHKLVCKPGEEQKLISLAKSVETRLVGLSDKTKLAGSNKLFVINAIMMQAELMESKTKISNLEKLYQRSFANMLSIITKYIDTLASRIKKK